MSEHYRALFVILFLTAPAFLLTRHSLARVVGAENFRRRWAAWFAITLLLFVAQNQWLFILGTAGLLWFFMRREENPIALYVMLLLAAPPLTIEIPGFGVVNYFVVLSHARMLALFLLLPAAIRIARDPRFPRLGRTGVDRLVLGFVAYITIMQLRETTITDTLRAGAYALTDTLLIYFVASRTLCTPAAMRQAMATVLIAAVPVALFAIFETAKSWLLYGSIPNALGVFNSGGYLFRDQLLRASVTAGHSLALGYYLAICIGILFFVAHFIHSRSQRLQLLVPLVLGLLASLARGPWFGAIAMYLAMAMLSQTAGLDLAKRLTSLMVSFVVILISPFGTRLVDLLPYIGKVDAFNVTYREDLLNAGLIVFARSPWVGSVTYLQTPEMLALIQGQGIVDIVNSYLGIALSYGAIGLSLFVLPFIIGLKRAFVLSRDPGALPEIRALATTLMATVVGMLLMIYTLSFIFIVPAFTWLLLGMLSALPAFFKSAIATQQSTPLTTAHPASYSA